MSTPRWRYEKLNKDELKVICDDNDITYDKKTKKVEMIDLLMEAELPLKSSKKNKAKEKTCDQKSKSKSKTTSKAKAKSKNNSKTESPLKSKETKNRPKSKPSKSAPKENQKRSCILIIPLIRELMDAIDKNILDEDRRAAIDTAEQLKIILDEYDFEHMNKMKKDMELSIKKVVDSFSSGVSNAKKKVKRDYTLKPSGVRFNHTLNAPSKAKITINLKQLRKEIDSPDFISSFTRSIKDLMMDKAQKYMKIRERVSRENEIIEAKVKKLKATGTTDRVIEDMYPCFSMMKGFKLDLEDLINLVRSKTNITEEQVKQNLLDALEDPTYGLCCIRGRKRIKNELAAQIYSFSKGYKTFVNSFNNIAIYGPSGSGKTFVAQIIAFVFSKIGVLAKNNIKIVTKADLTGQYIGHTAPRTRAALIETLEGILFVDEAYQLTEQAPGSKDYGGESIAELINFIDKYIGLNIVIVAGYEDKMRQTFMTHNEGLPRRFPYIYTLESYTDKQLTNILLDNLVDKLPDNIEIDDEISDYIFSLISNLRSEMPNSLRNQAGDMLNLASALNKTIISSYVLTWDNDDPENNKDIILAGFEDYLGHKNITISEIST